MLSAGVVIVRIQGPAPLFLLLRSYRYWDFPKGEVASGEDPLAAAVREVREETMLTELEFRWGRGYCETPPYGRGKVARYYLATSASGDVELPVDPALGRPEHHEYRWLGFELARPLLVARVAAVLDWAAARIEESS
jgi:8-oxo-dGTP pyrophosphatase MutT (NUDIX family)